MLTKTYEATFIKSRDVEVVQLLSEGVKTKEIGPRMFMSLHNVKRIINKLIIEHDCENAYHLVGTFFRKGLIH